MDKYTILAKKGAGTFSEVIKAQRISDGKMVAIKKMKAKYKSVEQVAKLREIQALKRLAMHPNIVQLLEVIYDPTSGRLALVFELMDSNLYEYIKVRKTYVPEPTLRLFLYQMVTALAFSHTKGIFHRDIKPENILVLGNILKFADFGSCRGIHSNPPYTEYISTRWYRAPEVIVSDGNYGPPMDVFALGCVFFELIALAPLFPGRNETDQIARIHHVLGTPDKALLDRLRKGVKNNPLKVDWPQEKGCGLRSLLPRIDGVLMNLLEGMLTYDPPKRFTAQQCLMHPYFDKIRADKPITAPRQELFETESKKMLMSQAIPSLDKGPKGGGGSTGSNINGNSSSVPGNIQQYQQALKGHQSFRTNDEEQNETEKFPRSDRKVMDARHTPRGIGDAHNNDNNNNNNDTATTNDPLKGQGQGHIGGIGGIGGIGSETQSSCGEKVGHQTQQGQQGHLSKQASMSVYNTSFAHKQNQQMKYLNYLSSSGVYPKGNISVHDQGTKQQPSSKLSCSIDSSMKKQAQAKKNNSHDSFTIGKLHQLSSSTIDSPKLNSSNPNANNSLTVKSHLQKPLKDSIVSCVVPGGGIDQLGMDTSIGQKSFASPTMVPRAPVGAKGGKGKPGGAYHMSAINRANLSTSLSVNGVDTSYETPPPQPQPQPQNQYNLPPIDMTPGNYGDTSYTKQNQGKKKEHPPGAQPPHHTIYASLNHPFGRAGIGFSSPSTSSPSAAPPPAIGLTNPFSPMSNPAPSIMGVNVKHKIPKKPADDPHLANGGDLPIISDNRYTKGGNEDN